MMETPIFQFKITLLGVRPLIWRRFRTHSDVSFRQLHNIVQIVMGWENYHLFSFSLGWDRFVQSQVALGDRPTSHRLHEFIQRESTTVGYEYDFGDRWQHELVLEKILNISRKPVPLCTHGRRACPPEDCGGPWGYMELAKAMKARRGHRYREYKEWLGGYFNPEEFDIREVNRLLADSEMWN